MDQIGEYREMAVRLGDAASQIILQYFGSDIKVEFKEDRSPVTIADRKAEDAIREILEHECPDHGFRGEETGEKNPDAEFVWMVDPIDGTKSFISGVPLFGTLIALLHHGQPVLGLMQNPPLGETYLGDNESCMRNGKSVRVNEATRLEDAILLCTDFRDVEKHRDREGFDRLAARVRFARTWGDCYGYGMVASGRADIMLDPIMSPWDIMALIPIIRGAGGVITDYYGADPVSADSLLAASPRLHAEVLSILHS